MPQRSPGADILPDPFKGGGAAASMTPGFERVPALLAPVRKVHAAQLEAFRGGAPARQRERTDGVDIFIGSGGDDLPHFGAMKGYAERYRADTGRPTRYFPNNREDAVLDAIREANQQGGPVNLVGHRWGGTDAYNIAARAKREGLRIDNLGTLDPVGGGQVLGIRLAGRDTGDLSVGQWVNVTANPGNPESGDWIAALGGKPSGLPIHNAGRNETVRATHADVDAMMAAGPLAMLNHSRSLAPPDDAAPIDEWMKVRGATREQR
ncbi:MAG: hypothetical protein AB1942_12820 [Pseudomonadota bacterium]